MKFIKSLKLNNFEGWVDGNIEFKNGFNVIMGDSDSGKSSIFRAIESIFTGKCLPENINKKSKDLKITLITSDNSTFIREYGKKGNKISFNENKFERIGREIPSEYFDFLGNSFINLGDNKKVNLCLYSQFDPHFFINFSDYDKSKLIGNVCGIGSIDKLVDLINKDIRDNNSKIKFLNEQIKEDEKEYNILEKEYKNEKIIFDNLLNSFTKIKEDYNILEFLFDSFNEFESFNELKNKKNNLKEKNNEIINSFNVLIYNELELIYRLYDDINECNKQYNNYNVKFLSNNKIINFDFKIDNELNNLFNYYENIKNINNQINLYESKIKNNLPFIKFDINEDEELNKLFYIYFHIEKINDEIKEKEKTLKMVKDEIKNLDEQNNNLLKDFDFCPLCGGKINV